MENCGSFRGFSYVYIYIYIAANLKTTKKALYRNTPAYAILFKKEKKRKEIYISIPRNKEGVENQPSLRSGMQRY